MKILKADPIGMCFGVRRAIETLEKALSGGKTVYAIGSPIHNPQEVERLRAKGLLVVENEETVPEGAIAFIRAHGVAPAVIERLERKGVTIIDGNQNEYAIDQFSFAPGTYIGRTAAFGERIVSMLPARFPRPGFRSLMVCRALAWELPRAA